MCHCRVDAWRRCGGEGAGVGEDSSKDNHDEVVGRCETQFVIINKQALFLTMSKAEECEESPKCWTIEMFLNNFRSVIHYRLRL